MTEPQTDYHERAQALLQKAEVQLKECQQSIENNTHIPLESFDETVRTFCDVLEEMPKDIAKEYEPSLRALATSLQAILEILNERKDVLKSQMEGLGQQQKAQAAYKTAPGYTQSESNE